MPMNNEEKNEKVEPVASKDFINMWVQALDENLLREDFFDRCILRWATLADDEDKGEEQKNKTYKKVSAKMFAVQRTIKDYSGGHGLKYPDKRYTKGRGRRKTELKDFVQTHLTLWAKHLVADNDETKKGDS